MESSLVCNHTNDKQNHEYDFLKAELDDTITISRKSKVSLEEELLHVIVILMP